jgi:hypothetical protein
MLTIETGFPVYSLCVLCIAMDESFLRLGKLDPSGRELTAEALRAQSLNFKNRISTIEFFSVNSASLWLSKACCFGCGFAALGLDEIVVVSPQRNMLREAKVCP